MQGFCDLSWLNGGMELLLFASRPVTKQAGEGGEEAECPPDISDQKISAGLQGKRGKMEKGAPLDTTMA